MRVLLIEDEVRLVEQVKRGLTAEGFIVEVALNGPDGVRAALERPIDVVVCDIMLPGLNGYDVVRTLRTRGLWVPIIMLTAKDGEYDQADAFELGADDYLTKPFSLVVLVARLRALLRRAGPERPVRYVAGDLSLDPATKRVCRGDHQISLTAREFGVLEFLLRSKGDVLTKREILDAVWDPHFEGDPNVVEVYVGYLRKKIDAPYGRAAIQTLRGMGYRLDPDGG